MKELTTTTIKKYLNQNELCVLSTASKTGKSQSAVMDYAFDPKTWAFYLFTQDHTRKFKNLQQNSKISLVIGGFKDDPSLQIDGLAKIVASSSFPTVKKFILSLHPEWKDYFDNPCQRFLKIKPHWLRYGDYSPSGHQIAEISDF